MFHWGFFKRKAKEGQKVPAPTGMLFYFSSPDEETHLLPVLSTPVPLTALKESPEHGSVDQRLTNQQQLPYELLAHIFSYLEGKRDLMNLCRCSRVFHEIAKVCLYRKIDLVFENKRGDSQHLFKATHAFKVLATIRDHRYSYTVTEMQVVLKACPTHVHVTYSKCLCDEIDNNLGQSLRSMHALEVLTIDCRLCGKRQIGRHHHLAFLPTQRLRKLYISCNSREPVSLDTTKLFTVNWMRSVTALNWGANCCSSIPVTTFNKWMKDGTFLSNLDTLEYNGPGIWDEILATRKIRRLSSPSRDPSTALNNHPNKKLITHLIINGHYLQQYFRDITVTNQYSNLQHVGTLVFSYGSSPTRDSVLQCVGRVLGLISTLKNLVSIDIYIPCPSKEHDHWDHHRLSQLQMVHPKLCKVLFHHIGIWVLGEGTGTWEMHTLLCVFLSWDIVTGMYDKY